MGALMAETKETQETKEARPGFVETLRAGWQPAQKRAKTTSPTKADAAKASASKTTESKAAAAKPDGSKTDGAKETPTTEATAGKRKPPAPNLEERMEGVQGWMAEIERKQGRMMYFGGAAVLLALAAAGVAIYLGVTAKSDSDAAKEDLDAIEGKVDGLRQAVTENTESTQKTLNQTVAGLQTSIDTLTKQQAQAQATITALQSQGRTGAGAVTPTPATPTPTPTTPANPGAKQP
jgi:uncharacterized protein YoxC